jgi:hypothetical protein
MLGFITPQIARKCESLRTILFAAAGILAVSLLTNPPGSLAQSPGAGVVPAQRPAFEVASIRPASPPTRETIQSGQFHTGTKIEGAHLDFGYTALWDLLPYAFRVKQYQMASPAWTHDSR